MYLRRGSDLHEFQNAQTMSFCPMIFIALLLLFKLFYTSGLGRSYAKQRGSCHCSNRPALNSLAIS